MSKARKNQSPPSPKFPSLLLIAAVVGIIIYAISQSGLYQISNPLPNATPPDYGNWKRVINQNAVFFSKIFLDRSSTYITIPLKFENGTKISWLILDSTSSAQPKAYLMTHPQLDQLSWSSVKDGPVYLYQRQKKYSDLNSFIASPPPRNKTAIDEGLIELERYKNIPGYPIDGSFQLDSVDFILTTYAPPKREGEIYQYENVVDASEANVNDENNLTWRIVVPDVSSASAYYLGQIHVDYNRKK